MTEIDYTQIIADLISKSERVQGRYLQQGHTNNTLYNGRLIDVDDQLFERGRYPLNAITNLIQTWCSLLVQSRPTAQAYAYSSELNDLYSAKIANAVIKYIAGEVDENTQIFEVVKKAALYGTAGLKVVYNPDSDRVEWSSHALSDFYLDPNAHIDGPNWVIFKSVLTEDELPQNIRYSPTDFVNESGESLSGQIVFELWHKPCRKYPKGIYCKLANDQPYDYSVYPYVFLDDDKTRAVLPLVLFKVRSQEGSVYGRTPVSDCVPAQRLINEYNTEITQLTRQSTNNFLVVPQSIANRLNLQQTRGLKVITFDSNTEANHAAQIKYTDTPAPPSQLYQERDYQQTKLAEIIGINGVTAGTDTKARSGTAIQKIAELDSLKNADAAKSLGTLILQAWQLTLNLVKTFYTGDRQYIIANEDPLVWSSADIAGVDVQLEPGSAYDRYTAARAEAKDPTVPNAFTARAELQAEEIIAQYLSGSELEILPEDTTEELINEIQLRSDKLLLSGKRDDAKALEDLIKGLKRQLVQAAAAVPPQEQ
jgi:hypothetical protein